MQKSLLFIPGPVAVSEPVLAAMAKPLINHRGPEYARLLHSIADRMQSIFAGLIGDGQPRSGSDTGILLTHNETSTGVQIDLGAMLRAIGDHPAYIVVDSVSGLGASEFKMDE